MKTKNIVTWEDLQETETTKAMKEYIEELASKYREQHEEGEVVDYEIISEVQENNNFTLQEKAIIISCAIIDVCDYKHPMEYIMEDLSDYNEFKAYIEQKEREEREAVEKAREEEIKKQKRAEKREQKNKEKSKIIVTMEQVENTEITAKMETTYIHILTKFSDRACNNIDTDKLLNDVIDYLRLYYTAFTNVQKVVIADAVITRLIGKKPIKEIINYFNSLI